MQSIPDYLRLIRETLLYAYIWQIPFSWRIIFDPSRSGWNTSFNEYMDISLYLGEVFIAFALLTHILEYKIENKSILKYLNEKRYRLFHVEHKFIYLALGILLVFINLLLSIDPTLSLVSALHIGSLTGFILLFLNIYVSRGTMLIKNILYILVFSLIIQLPIAFFQVLNASSIGITVLNESKLSLDMENVAKSNIFSNIYLRGYGTFLHPNILATYALLITVFSMYVSRSNLFHVKHHLQVLILVISGSTIILTQSKMALIWFFLILSWYLNDKFKLFHVEQLLKFIVALIFITVPSIIFLNGDAEQSFKTRISQFITQFEITPKEFFIGSGLGTYRLSYDKPAIDWWNYEPVHFVPMLVFKELGIFVFIGGIIYILNLIVYVPRETFNRLFGVWAFMLYVVITDHFAWDIYQSASFVVISFLLLYIDKYNNKCFNISNIKKQSEI